MKVTKLYEGAILPTRKNPTDAGLDLYAHGNSFVFPNSYAVISTGIAIELPPNTVGLIKPKSRNDHLVGAGVVDQNYRGNILVKVVNYSSQVMEIKHGDAIAQLLVIPCLFPQVEEVDKENFNTNTDRGQAGGIASQYKNMTAYFGARVEGA